METVCPNCRKAEEPDSEHLHCAPCGYCGSDGHSACQHAGPSEPQFEWVTAQQLLYHDRGTRMIVDPSGANEDVTATIELVSWLNGKDLIAVKTKEYRFQFVMGPTERVCVFQPPVENLLRAEVALLAEAEEIKREFADHDPVEFTRRVVEEVARQADAATTLHGGDGLTSCGGSCCEGFPAGARMDEGGD